MSVKSVPNKYEIFQMYYFDKNNKWLSITDAMQYYYELTQAEKLEFEKHYKEETGYEIIDANGFGLDNHADSTLCDKDYKDKDGNPTAKVIRTKKVKKKKKKDGKIVWYEKDVNVYASSLTSANKTNIERKATMDAIAKRRGIILDPVWSAYTAEEIMAMFNDGVNIPQDIVDLASTELEENSTITPDEEENPDGVEDETSEKEPFLDLVPKAKDKIEKCEETNDKLEKEITDLIPKQQKKKKDINDDVKKQRETLDEYQNSVKEYTKLQKKIENGDSLTEKETKRYEDLSKILGAQKNEADSFELDKTEITKSLNDINILAILGEKLADETVEVGEDLADYTSKTNYKATKASLVPKMWVGADFYMELGKALSKDAINIGNDTKEYTAQAQTSVDGIAETLDIKDGLASKEAVLNGEAQSSENNAADKVEEKNDQNKEQKMPLIISDKFVLDLIKEGKGINSNLSKQIKIANGQIKTAKGDIVFANMADKRITQIVEAFYDAEEKRQNDVEKTEQENEKKEQEIQNVMAEAQKRTESGAKSEKADSNNVDIDAVLNGQNGTENNTEVEYTDEEKKKIDTLNADISKNNQKITGIKQESVQHREQVKQNTSAEKATIDKAMPIEKDAQKVNQVFQEEALPEHNERMDFINKAGMILAGIGTTEITVGSKMIIIGHALMSNIWTLQQGITMVVTGSALLTKGTVSLGIGLTAMKVSDDESLIENAENKTDIAGVNINRSITDLSTVDKKIVDVTKAMSANDEEDNESTSAVATEDSNNENDDKEKTQNPQAEDATTPAQAASTQNVTTSTSETPNETSQTVNDATDAAEERVENEIKNTPSTDAPSVNKNQAEDEIKNNDGNEKSLTALNKQQKTGSKTSSSNKKETMSTDQAKKDVRKSKDSAKDSAKDSENVKRDTDKTNKQLEKESKTLTKKMKKDEKEIIKRTKESEKAAKRQEELVKRYDELNKENETLQAEDAANNTQAPAQPTAAANKTQATSTAPVAVQNDSQSANADKIASNSAEISGICSEFKVLKKTITTNRKVMLKLQKSTKTTQKKLNKKLKVIDKNNKVAEKKEQDKQKKLAKQLGAVGIAENIFSITLSTGMILAAIPWSAAVGQVMIQVGEYGVASCGVTKGTINLANGNLTAALMSIGQSAITIATAAAGPASTGAGSVLSAVAGGLTVVSSSAELVNNVRAVQGKEANGVLSKISTIAGVAGSLTNAAASLSSISGTASSLTKVGKIASTVGTALSSTSQMMSTFGGESKAANILGMVGGAVSMASSVATMAGAKKDDTNAKAATQKEEQEKLKMKQALDKQIEEQMTKMNQERVQMMKELTTQFDTNNQPATLPQNPVDTTLASNDASNTEDIVIRQVANNIQPTDMTVNAQIKGLDTPIAPLNLDNNDSGKKTSLVDKISKGVGAATNVVGAILQNGQNGSNQQQKKGQAPAANLDKRTKEIMKKNRKKRENIKKMLDSQKKIAALKKLRAAV